MVSVTQMAQLMDHDAVDHAKRCRHAFPVQPRRLGAASHDTPAPWSITVQSGELLQERLLTLVYSLMV